MDQFEAQLRVLSHRRTLGRGFALVHGANGLVRDPSQIKPDERLRLELAEGDLTVRPEVDYVMAKALPDPEELTYEEALEALEAIVQRAESGELPLEEAMAEHSAVKLC